MGENERMLIRLGQILERVTRPHRCDEALPADVQTALWQLGVSCSERTSREELVARLWARKRSLLTAVGTGWGGPRITPPTAA